MFADVTKDTRIVREEIFGPVVTVTRFSNEDEAVSIVNESDYGLTTAIYTADTTRGFRVARRIDVGMAFINNYFRGVIARRSAARSTPAMAARRVLPPPPAPPARPRRRSRGTRRKPGSSR